MATSNGLSPSTVWAVLALPNSPAGSIPYVATDNININIDPTNFVYNAVKAMLTISNINPTNIAVTVGDITGVPGAGTINAIVGIAKIAIAQTTINISNNLAEQGDIVFAMCPGVPGADATLKYIVSAYVSAAGNIVIIGNAAATAATIVQFLLIKSVVNV